MFYWVFFIWVIITNYSNRLHGPSCIIKGIVEWADVIGNKIYLVNGTLKSLLTQQRALIIELFLRVM